MKKKVVCFVLIGFFSATIFIGCDINEEIVKQFITLIFEKDTEWTDEDSNDLSPVEERILAKYKGLDYWNFRNYSCDEFNMNSEDIDLLISNLENADKSTLRGCILGEITPGRKRIPGHCYGMAITEVVRNRGLVQGASLKTIKKSKMSDREIEFYYVQQALAPNINMQRAFVKQHQDTQLKKLMRVALSGEPFVICYGWYKPNLTKESAHAVVGYGVESGNWSEDYDFHGQTYPYRILIEDSNYPGDTSGKYYIYINMDTNIWCIPGYKIYSTSRESIHDSSNNNGRLRSLVTDGDYLNMVNYTNGETSDVYKKSAGLSVATVISKNMDNIRVETSNGSATINGTVISHSTIEDIDVFSMCDASDVSSLVFITLPNESYYKVYSNNSDLNFIFRVSSTCLVVESNAPGEATINGNGIIEIKCDKEDATTKVEYTTSDKKISLDGRITIIEKKGSYITLNPSMKDIRINTNPDAKVMISSKEFGATAKKQTDTGDIVAKGTIPKLNTKFTLKSKKTAYTGKTVHLAADSKKNINEKNYYVYYKDKKCMKLTEIFKDSGTYYVPAKRIISGYVVKSNIAKLEIKKSLVNVKFLKTAFDCKSSNIKKKKRMFHLKTPAKGVATYKKVSGNKNVSSIRKFPVKNGTKAGTYKINAMATSKNYKKKVLRIIIIDEKDYFYGVDIARALMYARPSKVVSNSCKGILILDTIKNESGYLEKLIQEGDMYRFIYYGIKLFFCMIIILTVNNGFMPSRIIDTTAAIRICYR